MSITHGGSGSNYLQNTDTGSLLAGGFIVVFIIIFVISLAIGIFMIVSLYKIFKKNNRPGWYSIIPVLNTWTLFEIAGNKGWLCLIPFVNIIFLYISAYKLALKMGKGPGIGILTALVPIIGYPILAFSKNTTSIGEENNMNYNNEFNNQSNAFINNNQGRTEGSNMNGNFINNMGPTNEFNNQSNAFINNNQGRTEGSNMNGEFINNIESPSQNINTPNAQNNGFINNENYVDDPFNLKGGNNSNNNY